MNEAQAPVDGALYAARQKIYPRDIKGRFQRLRVYAVFALLGLYYVLPWICLLYTSPSPRDGLLSRMPSSA